MRDKKILTTGDIAAHCQVSYETVVNWIRSDKLASYLTPGRHHRVRREDFVRFLAAHGMPPLEEEARTRQRILVVDDEPGVLQLITDYLKRIRAPYDLATAADGFEAGIQVARFQPDLMVLDLMMPNLDGFKVCRLIRSNPETRHIAILVITGFAQRENIHRALECGADQCLAKPFSPAELLEKTRTLLAQCHRARTGASLSA